MMPSPKQDPGLEPLPPALSSMWRLCKLGYRHEPRLMLVSFVLSQLAALPDALLALWLWLLGKGVLQHRTVWIEVAAVGLGVSTAATWFLRTVSTRVQRRFRDKVTIALESHVARLQATVVTVAHQERPEYLDRLSMLRNQVFVLDHMYMSLFSTLGWVLRLGVTMALLASIHPALLLLAVFAIPTVLTSGWRPAVERAAQERGAPSSRLARHLFTIATTAAPGKEVRVTGIGERLVTDRRAAWERWYAPVAAARWGSAWWLAAGMGDLRPGLCGRGGLRLLVSARARQLGAAGAGRGGAAFRVHWRHRGRDWIPARILDGRLAAAGLARRLCRVGGRVGRSAGAPGLASWSAAGARFLRLSRNLPGGARGCVAVVARRARWWPSWARTAPARPRWSSCWPRCTSPRPGSILVDDVPLARLPAAEWRARLAGAFQDFFRFEFRAGHTVGLGDVPRMDDEPAVAAAVDRAGAGDVVARLASGLDTQLGPTWPNGVELSFGQWQKLALARGFMRDQPLLLILDEPTAALDAETEHALFERYAAAARGTDTSGRITILVSHRFSTVRMADLIVVLDGARLVEVGTHEELMAKNGQYAELYGIQAAAYR